MRVCAQAHAFLQAFTGNEMNGSHVLQGHSHRAPGVHRSKLRSSSMNARSHLGRDDSARETDAVRLDGCLGFRVQGT